MSTLGPKGYSGETPPEASLYTLGQLEQEFLPEGQQSRITPVVFTPEQKAHVEDVVRRFEVGDPTLVVYTLAELEERYSTPPTTTSSSE